MRLVAIAAVIFALLGAAPAASPPPTATPNDLARTRLDTMLRSGHADSAWFSDDFLAAVAAGQVDAVIASLTKTLGAYENLEYTPPKFVAHFAKGTDDVLIHLDSQSKIDGLRFKPPVLAGSSLDDALAALRQFDGSLSYTIVVEGRSELAAFNASEPLAVGSAFKLAVLNGLVDRIRRGDRHWKQVVPLQDRWKSLPTGVLRSWPAGTPLTLATYAAEMISISDNTAADALVRLVGPAALEPYAAGNEPFLTTREMFTLKSDEGAGLRAQYAAASTPEARRRILQRVDALPLPALDQLMATPEPAIEWHYSVRELCRLMRRVADLPLMSINPGVAERSAFRRVAFKGGSDVGAINLTTMVTTKRRSQLCFSATLNNAARAVDDTAFEMAYAAVLRFLASR